MYTKSRKLLSTLLVLTVLFSIFAAFPLTASAAHGPSTIDLDDLTTGESNTNWSYAGVSNTITLTGDVAILGGTVLATDTLNIDAGVHNVTWQVTEYSGALSGPLINVTGTGYFTVDSGSSIIQSGDGNAIAATTVDRVYLYGGTVSATTGTAIHASSVTLSGGTVSATTGTAIDATRLVCLGTATVNGKVNTSSEVWADTTSGTLTINGAVTASGTVYASGGGTAIVNGNVSATRAGAGEGTLTIDGDVAVSDCVWANDGGTVYITGTVRQVDDAISIDNSGNKNFDVGTPTTTNGLSLGGYYWDVYTNTAVTAPSSYVYLRQGQIPTPPSPDTGSDDSTSTAAAPPAAPNYYRVLARTLNQRSGPGTGWAILGTLPMNTLVEIVGISADGNWALTKNGTWLSMGYLVKVNSITGAGLYSVNVRAGSHLNVRFGAGTGYGIIGSLASGTLVNVLSIQNGWAMIEFQGGYAYVSVVYLI